MTEGLTCSRKADRTFAQSPTAFGGAPLEGGPERARQKASLVQREVARRYIGAPPKPSASGFGGERRCDGVSETCPVSQGRGEGYTVRTDETEGLTV